MIMSENPGVATAYQTAYNTSEETIGIQIFPTQHNNICKIEIKDKVWMYRCIVSATVSLNLTNTLGYIKYNSINLDVNISMV